MFRLLSRSSLTSCKISVDLNVRRLAVFDLRYYHLPNELFQERLPGRAEPKTSIHRLVPVAFVETQGQVRGSPVLGGGNSKTAGSER